MHSLAACGLLVLNVMAVILLPNSQRHAISTTRLFGMGIDVVLTHLSAIIKTESWLFFTDKQTLTPHLLLT